MNVVKIIKEATFHIEAMKAKIPYIKKQEILERHIAMTNAFIQLLNAAESMMYQKLQIDLLDKLLLARLRDYFMQSEAAVERVPIYTIIQKIDADLNEPIELRLKEVVDILESIEVSQLLKKIEFNKKPNGLNQIDYSKTSIKEVNNVTELLLNKTSSDEYRTMVIDLINQFKEKSKWN